MRAHEQPYTATRRRFDAQIDEPARLREMRAAGNSISMLTCLGASFARLFVRQVKSETFPDNNLHGL